MTLTKEKLEELRKQFGASDGGMMITPEFRNIADKIFTEGGRRQAPYAGLPTLLDAPAALPENLEHVLATLQVALYGVPMDLAVTNRNGSRFGPRALRAIERIGPYKMMHSDARPSMKWPFLTLVMYHFAPDSTSHRVMRTSKNLHRKS